LILFLCLLGSFENSHGGLLDKFSGLTGRTGNDAKVSVDNYAPEVVKVLAKLKGKQIHLANFSNNAENTKQFSYPSAEGNFFYVVGHGSVESYFWYCFQKGLLSADIKVLEETPGGTTPSLLLKLLYLTDRQFRAEIVVTKGKDFFKKKIETTFEPPQSGDRDELAFQAYRFMDKIIGAVMTDPETIKALGF
jgi:hypothetical protein